MTSETDVENQPFDPDARPLAGDRPPTLKDLEKQIDDLGEQIAELIKDRDRHRDRAEVLERSAVLMTSLLAEAEITALEAKLELAKGRAKQARQLVREGKPLGGSHVIDVYLFERKADATTETNGQDT